MAQAAGLEGEASDPAHGEEPLEHVEWLAQTYLDIQYQVLMEGERGLRAGGLDVVHGTRVATRRYRSVLREIRGLLDPSSATVLDEGLRWYARLLGDVRDVQVLRATLDEELDRRPDDARTLVARSQAHAYLTDRLDTASGRLREAFETRRYASLSSLLGEWHRGMPFLTDLQPSSREALTFLRGAERRFQRRLDAAVAAGRPDLLMHEARKSGKRARYVAEMAAPALGERADRTIRRMTLFQNEIGTRQDRVIARDALTELAASPAAKDSATAGLFEDLADQLSRQ